MDHAFRSTSSLAQWSARRWLALTVAVWFLAFAGLGCGDDDGTGPPSNQPFGLVFVVQPGGAESESLLTPQPIVELRNFNNERVIDDSTSTVTVTIASGPARAILSGTTVLTVAQGRATFTDLSIDVAGSFTLGCTTNRGPWKAIGSPLTVTAGPLAQLAFFRQASGGQPSIPFTGQPIVALQDAAGNTRTQDSGTTVTVSIETDPTAGVATLSGSTSVVASAGVADWPAATLPLSIDTLAEGYRLRFVAASASVIGAPFNIHGPPMRLAFVQQPTTTPALRSIDPAITVAIRDAAGVRATGYIGSVRLRVNDGPVRNIIAASGDGLQGELGVLEVADPDVPVVLGTLSGAPSAGVLAMVYDPGRGAIFAMDVRADLLRLDAASGTPTRVGHIAGLTPSPFGGNFPPPSIKGLIMESPGGRLLGVEVGGNRLIAIEPSNAQSTALGAITIVGGTPTIRGFSGLARHPVSGAVYAVAKLSTGGWGSQSPGTRSLVIVDLPTRSATVVGTILAPLGSPPVAAIFFTPDGTLYALADVFTIELYRVNIATAEATPMLIMSDNGFDTAGCSVPKPLGGTTSTASIMGLATFPSIRINAIGPDYSLRAQANGVADAVSSLFVITP